MVLNFVLVDLLENLIIGDNMFVDKLLNTIYECNVKIKNINQVIK